MRVNTTSLIAGAAAVALLGGGAGAFAVHAVDGTGAETVREVTVAAQSPVAETASSSVSAVYRKAYRGVVEITVTTDASTPSPFGAPGSQQAQAQGSGFVLDTTGHVVTNQHVVDGATEISVRLWDGSSYSARVVGTDASTDLAVLEVDAPAAKLHPLTLGSSASLEVGDGVIAIGSPFGLEETVTSGIVSALHRQITAPNEFSIDDAIQTDAAINHGNSGGPLLDTLGRVVGVNSQIESDGGGSDGVGFAVPADTIRTVAAQLISGGTISHAYLGVSVATITQSARKAARPRRRRCRDHRARRHARCAGRPSGGDRRPDLRGRRGADRRRRDHRARRRRRLHRRRAPCPHRRQAPRRRDQRHVRPRRFDAHRHRDAGGTAVVGAMPTPPRRAPRARRPDATRPPCRCAPR